MDIKEGPKLSYLNIRIIKSPYRIIIDQTYHIQDNILEQWFPYDSEKVNSIPNPIKEDSNF